MKHAVKVWKKMKKFIGHHLMSEFLLAWLFSPGQNRWWMACKLPWEAHQTLFCTRVTQHAWPTHYFQQFLDSFPVQINDQDVEVTFENPSLGDHFDKLREMKGFKEWIQRMDPVRIFLPKSLLKQKKKCHHYYSCCCSCSSSPRDVRAIHGYDCILACCILACHYFSQMLLQSFVIRKIYVCNP